MAEDGQEREKRRMEERIIIKKSTHDIRYSLPSDVSCTEEKDGEKREEGGGIPLLRHRRG